jgi:hypothetical protein
MSSFSALKMEAVCFSETLPSTRRQNSEERHHQTGKYFNHHKIFEQGKQNRFISRSIKSFPSRHAHKTTEWNKGNSLSLWSAECPGLEPCTQERKVYRLSMNHTQACYWSSCHSLQTNGGQLSDGIKSNGKCMDHLWTACPLQNSVPCQ